jgi:hypothetical protein
MDMDSLACDPTIEGRYRQVKAFLPDAGALARVIPASDNTTGAAVVLKIQPALLHAVEMNAFHLLRGVPGVVAVLDCFTRGTDRGVLVLPRLEPVQYGAVARTPGALAEFAHQAVSIVRAMHARDVVHGDLKPAAFMRDPCSGQYTAIDFNAAGRASTPVKAGRRLPGTPGWVLDEVPATRREHGDLVGLASVLGWLLGVRGFGDAGTCHATALDATAGALHRSQEPTRVKLLGLVLKLLHLQPLANIWPVQDPSAEEASVQVRDPQGRCLAGALAPDSPWINAACPRATLCSHLVPLVGFIVGHAHAPAEGPGPRRLPG